MTRHTQAACSRPLTLTALVVLVVLAALLTSAPAADARPGSESVSSLQARAAETRAELSRLDDQASALIERYNLARAELDATSSRLVAARRELARDHVALEQAQSALDNHLAEMYKGEEPGLLEILLSLGDFSDLTTQLDYLQLIHEADADEVAGLAALTAQAEARESTLENARQQALVAERDLRERRADIEAALTQRKALLDDLDDRITRRLALEAEREAAAAKALATQAGIDLDGLDATPVQKALVAETMKYLGIPYVWGGATPSQGFDCSGLVMYVYAKFGVGVLHGATLQSRGGEAVPLTQLHPADLVFFGTTTFYHHVGIYIGDGLFIEAPHTGDVVKISRLAGRNCTYACRYPIRSR